MIFVRAAVKVKPGVLRSALAVYQDFVPKVLAAEPGCVEYTPTLDLDLGLPNQVLDENLILVSERWHSADDFRAHLSMPHTVAFRAQILPFLDGGITVSISQSAL